MQRPSFNIAGSRCAARKAAGLQPTCHHLEWLRLREKITLHDDATGLLQEQYLLLRLYAFSNTVLSEISDKIDHGFNDLFRFGIDSDVGNETAVNFDFIELKISEIGQGREA